MKPQNIIIFLTHAIFFSCINFVQGQSSVNKKLLDSHVNFIVQSNNQVQNLQEKLAENNNMNFIFELHKCTELFQKLGSHPELTPISKSLKSHLDSLGSYVIQINQYMRFKQYQQDEYKGFENMKSQLLIYFEKYSNTTAEYQKTLRKVSSQSSNSGHALSATDLSIRAFIFDGLEKMSSFRYNYASESARRDYTPFLAWCKELFFTTQDIGELLSEKKQTFERHGLKYAWEELDGAITRLRERSEEAVNSQKLENSTNDYDYERALSVHFMSLNDVIENYNEFSDFVSQKGYRTSKLPNPFMLYLSSNEQFVNPELALFPEALVRTPYPAIAGKEGWTEKEREAFLDYIEYLQEVRWLQSHFHYSVVRGYVFRELKHLSHGSGNISEKSLPITYFMQLERANQALPEAVRKPFLEEATRIQNNFYRLVGVYEKLQTGLNYEQSLNFIEEAYVPLADSVYQQAKRLETEVDKAYFARHKAKETPWEEYLQLLKDIVDEQQHIFTLLEEPWLKGEVVSTPDLENFRKLHTRMTTIKPKVEESLRKRVGQISQSEMSGDFLAAFLLKECGHFEYSFSKSISLLVPNEPKNNVDVRAFLRNFIYATSVYNELVEQTNSDFLTSVPQPSRVYMKSVKTPKEEEKTTVADTTKTSFLADTISVAEEKQSGLGNLPALNFVLLVDVSASMNKPQRLPLLKKSLGLLATYMRPQDRISIVKYVEKPLWYCRLLWELTKKPSEKVLKNSRPKEEQI